MKKVNFSFWLLVFVSVLGILQPILFYNELPEKVASHFVSSGAADSFMEKNTFVAIVIGVILFLDLLFFGLSKLMNILSDSGFNLPNKEYWLHPDRREKTIFTFKKMLYNVSALTILFLMAIIQKIIECNINGTYRLDKVTFMYLIIYVVGLSFYLIVLYLKFQKIPVKS